MDPATQDAACPKSDAAMQRLIDAMALRILSTIDDGGTQAVLRKLTKLEEMVLAGNRAEMTKIDERSNGLAVELDAIAKAVEGEQAKALVPRLNKIRDNLNALGRIDGPT